MDRRCLSVGAISATDTDADESSGSVRFEIALVDGVAVTPESSPFEIDDQNNLLFTAQPDFETKSSYSVTVHATDAGGKTYAETFVVNITDANDAPGFVSTGHALSNGFVINGIFDSESGASVSSTGDLNGDGYDDLIIGAPYADPNGSNSGESYVIFGQAAYEHGTLDLATMLGLQIRAYVAEGTTDVGYTAQAVDPDAGDAVTYTLGSSKDEALFHIHGTSGDVSFIDAPDYEVLVNPDGSRKTDPFYVIDIIASDGLGGFGTQEIIIEVTNIFGI